MKYPKIFILIPIVLTSCFSSSVLQTAKPTEKGNTSIKIGLAGSVGQHNGGVLPEFSLRRGISNFSDLGFKYSLHGAGGHLVFDYKQLILKSRNKFLSSGIAFEIYDFEDHGNYGVSLPLYFSLNHDKKNVIYFGQKFSFSLKNRDLLKLWNTDPGEIEIRKTHNMYYTGGIGCTFGQKRTKWIEFSYGIRFFKRFESFRPITGYSQTNNANIYGDWTTHQESYNENSVQITLGMNLKRKSN